MAGRVRGKVALITGGAQTERGHDQRLAPEKAEHYRSRDPGCDRECFRRRPPGCSGRHLRQRLALTWPKAARSPSSSAACRTQLPADHRHNAPTPERTKRRGQWNPARPRDSRGATHPRPLNRDSAAASDAQIKIAKVEAKCDFDLSQPGPIPLPRKERDNG